MDKRTEEGRKVERVMGGIGRGERLAGKTRAMN